MGCKEDGTFLRPAIQYRSTVGLWYNPATEIYMGRDGKWFKAQGAGVLAEVDMDGHLVPGGSSLTVKESDLAPRVREVSNVSTASDKDIVHAIRQALGDASKCSEEARRCFEFFDADRDGFLDFHELLRSVEDTHARLGVSTVREEDVDYYLRRFDTTGRRRLSPDEHERLYRNLLLLRLNELEPMPFSRDMFVGQRDGTPKDHYELKEGVGVGSHGIVRKAMCNSTQTVRVVKAIKMGRFSRERSGTVRMQAAVQEIETLKALDHPAILRLFEYYVLDDAIHLVTDLLPGGELLARINAMYRGEATISEQWACDVFQQICEGVAYIHAKGVIHKDLKPENIMLCSDQPPVAVVIDVGVAELFPPEQGEEYRSGLAKGTATTMAPEVFLENFTCKCDVWSLGCCLYALFCHTPLVVMEDDGETVAFILPYPFLEHDMEDWNWRNWDSATLHAHLTRMSAGHNVTLINCSPLAKDLISKLLTFDESDRPGMTAVLQHPWFQDDEAKHHILRKTHVDCLVHFTRANLFERAVLLDVAARLPLGKLRDLTDLFKDADTDKDGMLSQSELAAAMEQAGLDGKAAKDLAERFCGSGQVEFSKFVAALMPSTRELLLSELRSAFLRLDADGDGFLSAAELDALMDLSKLRHLKDQGAFEELLESARSPQHGSEHEGLDFRRFCKHFEAFADLAC